MVFFIPPNLTPVKHTLEEKRYWANQDRRDKYRLKKLIKLQKAYNQMKERQNKAPNDERSVATDAK